MFVHRVLHFVMLFCSLLHILVHITFICRFNSCCSKLLPLVFSCCTVHVTCTFSDELLLVSSVLLCCGLAYLVFFGRDVYYCAVTQENT
jgi:hypothetical protein